MYHHSVAGFIHNSVFVCSWFVCVQKKKKKKESMMCQGKETYGGRQSEEVSGVQPGHVPAALEDIFYARVLNT